MIREGSGEVSDTVRELAEQAGPVLERINHPGLRTIYPPTAQAGFAVAYRLSPFDIDGLRWTWLALELMVVALLVLLLREESTWLFQLAVYWLNPLLVKEIFNAAHMELIVIAPVIAAVAAAVHYRATLCALLLGLAAGAKIWPILLAPLMLRRAVDYGGRTLRSVAVLAGMGTLLMIPLLLSRLDASSGMLAYVRRWQMNDSAFLLLHELSKWISEPHAQWIARAGMAALIIVVVLLVLRRYRPTDHWLFTSLLVVAAALFLLSPTQFPWYYLWLLPFLALRPAWSLIALTVTLPIYYLRFPLDAVGHAAWFDYGLVWLEFVPIWALLLWEERRRRREASIAAEESSACIATIV